MLTEQATWDGRTATVTWMPAPFEPPRDLTTQAYGLCFTAESRLVLVSHDGAEWNLPGGHPEPGETLEQALVREVWEEACSRVTHCQYLGSQRVEDPGNPEGLPVYYQARYWARVELDEFQPQFERRHRRLVAPDQFLSSLYWGRAAIAATLLQSARSVEARMRPAG
jgi:8-oxo-dGTP pyrophosphatase MutT (NUDIX family)